ncbi:hypothetical protein [Arthrobacter sp. CP30]
MNTSIDTTRGKPLDHGILSGIRRRNTPRQARQHAAGIERTIDQAKASVAAQQDTERQQDIAANRERNAPVPFTSEELKAARAVRTTSGWHRVAKVNAKSVSVETGYSWTDRYTLAQILEVRA